MKSAHRVRGTAAGTLWNEQHYLQQLNYASLKAGQRRLSGTLYAITKRNNGKIAATMETDFTGEVSQ
jgi:hypothetical protein